VLSFDASFLLTDLPQNIVSLETKRFKARSYPMLCQTPSDELDATHTQICGHQRTCVIDKSVRLSATQSILLANVLFIDKPRWRRRAWRKRGCGLSHSCRIVCSVDSNPAAHQFHWLDKSAANVSASSSAYSVLSSGNRSVLSIASVALSDYGSFTCVAVNSVGTGRFQLSLLQPGIYTCVVCVQLLMVSSLC